MRYKIRLDYFLYKDFLRNNPTPQRGEREVTPRQRDNETSHKAQGGEGISMRDL